MFLILLKMHQKATTSTHIVLRDLQNILSEHFYLRERVPSVLLSHLYGSHDTH